MRTASLTSLPIFLDEALHIDRGFRTLQGNLFNDGFEQNKWLYSVSLAIFNPDGPESIFIARYWTAILAVLTIATCISLGRLLDADATGLLAGAIYAIVPFAVFHERQALVDPMMATFSMLAVVMAVRYLKKPQATYAIGLTVFLMIAYLTKLAAAAYFFVPLVAICFLPLSVQTRIKRGGVVVLCVTIAGGVLAGFYKYLHDLDIATAEAYSVGQDNLLLDLPRVTADLAVYTEILWRYLGLMLCILIVLSLIVLATRSGKRRELLFLMFTIGGLTLVPFIVSRPAGLFLPRYVFYAVPPLVVLCALTLAELNKQSKRFSPVLLPLALVVIAVQALWFNFLVVVRPEDAPLVAGDRSQYITGTPSSFELQALSDYVLAQSKQSGRPAFVVVEDRTEHLQAYFGRKGASLSSLRQATDGERFAMSVALARGELAYIVDDERVEGVLELPLFGEVSEPIERFEGNAREIQLYQVVSTEDPLAMLIYERLVALPETMTDDINTISALTGPSIRYALPANFSDRLAAQPLDVGQWPLTSTQAERTIPIHDPDMTFAVIWVDESLLDPQRHMPLALSSTYFPVREHWSGLLHSVEYDTGPAQFDLRENGVVLEGVISLLSDSLIDTQASPGGYVRVLTTWETAVDIEDSFELFFHLLDENDLLVAQSDGAPVNNLRPTNTWGIEEPIIDRRVVHIPNDLAPGEYRLFVGMYLPQAGLRLPITDHGPAEIETTGDAILLGTVNIE